MLAVKPKLNSLKRTKPIASFEEINKEIHETNISIAEDLYLKAGDVWNKNFKIIEVAEYLGGVFELTRKTDNKNRTFLLYSFIFPDKSKVEITLFKNNAESIRVIKD